MMLAFYCVKGYHNSNGIFLHHFSAITRKVDGAQEITSDIDKAFAKEAADITTWVLTRIYPLKGDL